MLELRFECTSIMLESFQEMLWDLLLLELQRWKMQEIPEHMNHKNV